MPGMGGLEACRRIREVSPCIGIVIVSVREALDDKVRAFEAGADDYIMKPFRFRELAARLSAVRRRIRPCEKSRPMLRVANLELDPENRTFRRSGQEIHLSQKEFGILIYLMSRPNTTVPHARLLQAVWGPGYGGETEYLRTYIKPSLTGFRLLRRREKPGATRHVERCRFWCFPVSERRFMLRVLLFRNWRTR